MTAYQLTVPVDNKPGRLAQVSGILNREKINIRA
ncbi:MAG: acetolactate synthase, partial [Deltaproteobacteria bacterium]|nr:acetolactate synthase [Deltaproteobacteria bacterium]